MGERVLRLPRRLPQPATLGVFAPSGRVDDAQMAAASRYFVAAGHRVVVAEESAQAWRYFAGTDEARAASFHRMLDDPTIDLMIAARGGYGITRILERIDWNRVAASGKVFMGFSDFTAFNLAACACANLLTFQGPLFAIDFGHGVPDAFMEQHFFEALSRGADRVDDIACEHGYSPGRIDGRLWGGNLSMLAHLVGTPYFPLIDDGILFVEEIAEEPYAVERLFFQLHHAGVLGRQRALVLGDFTDCGPTNTARYPYAIDEVVETLRALLPYPVLTQLPFGHVARKLTLPFGAPATLTIREGGYGLRYADFLSP